MGPTAQVDIVLVQHLLNFWSSRGVEMDPIWPLLGIDIGDPLPRWVNSERVADAHRYAFQFLNDDLIGIDLGQYVARRDLPMARLLRYADTLRTGLTDFVPYFYLMTGSVCLELQVTDVRSVISIERKTSHTMSQLQQSAALACIAEACRIALGKRYEEDDLLLCIPKEFMCYQRAIEQRMKINVTGASGFGLEISGSAWQRLNLEQQPILYASVLRDLRRQDEKFKDHLAIYNELRDILQMCLLKRHVSQDDVADQLGISVRNLQRRLKALGTTYQNLLDEGRQALAMKVIREGDMPLYEVAYLVGYTEPSAFYKAFKRWTGSTPGDYRQAYQERLSAVSNGAE
ncbi:MAG: helix-turn-helix transcriptional regulator [Thalassolituus sp.]|uniref:helix-turn-helix domain-containing protein n=1 Tax=Thalassolituus sp. TaxID=2030822 RepID=UPI0039819BEF